jgi:hypothetical protein
VRCSICYTILSETDPVTVCPDCKQDYHKSCWDDIGGCGSYGCKRAAVAQKPPLPVLVGAGWGDTKRCPQCGNDIGSSLLVCNCKARFPWADPMTAGEYNAWLTRQNEHASARKLMILLFIMTVIGIIAPITGSIAGIYAWRKRSDLAGTGGTYLAMGYGSAALAVSYSVLIVVLALGY